MNKGRFLILGNIWEEAYLLEELDVKELVDLKQGNSDYAIDLEKNEYFDHKQNKWTSIPVKKKGQSHGYQPF